MSYATILYTKKGHIAGVTLNRPDVDNIVNQQLAGELQDVAGQINRDDDVHVVVVSGAGAGVFCGGSDLERLIQGADTAELSSAKLENVPARTNAAAAIAGISRPVIAAINGDALGQGLELALSCDVRLASAKARFGFPQVAAGLMPMDGGTQRLPRLVGRGKALELVLTGETISAGEALEIGLVSQVVAAGNLAAEAEALAQTIASKAPIAVRYIKEAVNKGLDMTLEQGLRLEADLYFLLHTTADRTEGINAFLQKRPPQFKGQ